MELTPEAVGALLLAAIVMAAAAIVVALMALNGQRRVRGAYRAFSQGSREDVLTLLQRHIDEVGALRGDVARLERRSDELRELLRSSVSRVGAVRYDAFEELGGRLSFSAALLDEHGDGLVLTAINGRTDTRTYAKSVTGGRSKHNLSEEEIQAIEQAMAMAGRTRGSREGAPTGGGRPGSRRPAPSR